MNKRIKFLQALGTHKVGDVAELASAIADGLIAGGVAELVPDETTRTADTVVEGLRADLTRMVAEEIRSAAVGTGRRPNVNATVGDDGGAADEATEAHFHERRAAAAIRGNWVEFDRIEMVPEERSMGDFFQQLSFAASPSHGRYQGACNRLHNKYRSRFNPNFGADYDRGMRGSGMPDNPRAQVRASETRASNMVETTGALGGFTLPLEFFPDMIRLAQQQAILFPRVRKYPMGGLQMQIPALDYSSTTAGQNPYLAGMAAGWSAEGQSFTQQNPLFRQINLKANLLTGYTVASRSLLADSAVGLEAVLKELISETIGFYVDYAILNGTGVDQPQGILNGACLIKQTRTAAANGSFLADLGAMYGKLLPEAEGRAFWLIPPSAKTAFISMTGPNGSVTWIPNIVSADGGGATRRLPIMTFGHDMFVSQLPKSSLTSGDIWLIDPDNYAFGLRQDIEIGVSEHVNFLSNLLTWRFIFRGDGQPRLNTFLTLQNGDQVSPFLMLN